MKATELRIGNLVEFKGQIVPILKIDSMNELVDAGKLIYKGSVTVPEYSNARDRRIWNYNSPWIDQLSAVPLTEEWLKRFGFVNLPVSWSKEISDFQKEEYKAICITLNQGIILRCGLQIDSRGKDDLMVIWNTDVRGPLFVHSLQNIFYWITGSELEAKHIKNDSGG